MITERYDVVVAGAGGMGGAALYHLARRGVRACAVERFGIAHDRGSSHGDTRIIRKAYMEHPDYVPLLHRAYVLWEELEAEEAGGTLCPRRTAGGGRSQRGGDAGAGSLLSGARPAARIARCGSHGRALPKVGCASGVEWLLRSPRRFSPCRGLRPSACRVGSEARREALRRGGHAVVATRGRRSGRGNRATASARRRLVLATGAWAVPELCRLGIAACVVRKVQLWYQGRGVEQYARGSFPCFFIADGEQYFYGFPAQDPWGLKLAEHNLSHDPVADPLQLNRALAAGDQPCVLDFLARFFPALQPDLSKHAACMYSLTPDKHFVLDIHSECPAVVLGAGFSGHGFKFAPVSGRNPS